MKSLPSKYIKFFVGLFVIADVSSVSVSAQIEKDLFKVNVSDRDAQPLIRIPPRTPNRFLEGSNSGFCEALFDVSGEGKTFNIKTTLCTSSLLENATIESITKWKYNPKVVDGKPVVRTGVEAKVLFNLADENGDILPFPEQVRLAYEGKISSQMEFVGKLGPNHKDRADHIDRVLENISQVSNPFYHVDGFIEDIAYDDLNDPAVKLLSDRVFPKITDSSDIEDYVYAFSSLSYNTPNPFASEVNILMEKSASALKSGVGKDADLYREFYNLFDRMKEFPSPYAGNYAEVRRKVVIAERDATGFVCLGSGGGDVCYEVTKYCSMSAGDCKLSK